MRQLNRDTLKGLWPAMPAPWNKYRKLDERSRS